MVRGVQIVLGLTLGLTGCSGSDGAQPSVFPAAAYTGIETDTSINYVVPLALTRDVTGAVWSTADPSIVAVSGWDCGADITGLKAGTTTVSVAVDGHQVDVPVTVYAYTSAQRLAGAGFYAAHGCAGCHEAPGAPDITSSGIGHHPDVHIQAAVTMGKNPEGGDIAIGAANHSFAIASGSDAYVGIAAYLRSVPAKGDPVQDK